MAEEQPALFDPAEFPEPPQTSLQSFAPLSYPLWTEHKAALIARYLRFFVLITKHGTYIDGFAGPQNDYPGMWAAKLVIESEPRWFRHFHLVELDRKKVAALQELKAASDAVQPNRTITVYRGDFNVIVDQILSQNTITPKEATFCLLDQRTFECRWSSVAKLANYKPRNEHKIELFYFLPIGWLDRSLAATKDEAALKGWWGRADWQVVLKKSATERAQMFASRIQSEFNYASVVPWPIYEQRGGKRIMYFMIHATDHPDAPNLMRRAYIRAVDPWKPVEQLGFAFT
jgi:three-Cys-motif partner protein